MKRIGKGWSLSTLVEVIRNSLFFVPALFLLGAAALSLVTVAIDDNVAREGLPTWLIQDSESSRTLLGSVAGGIMAAAAVVLSLMLVAMQLAASRFSPRVVRDFIRDPFVQTVVGIELSVVAYSLLVLLRVGNERALGLSVAAAVLGAVIALVALVAGIDHLARSLPVTAIARRITDETLETIEHLFAGSPERLFLDPTVVPSVRTVEPPADAVPIRAWKNGWVQQIREQELLEAMGEGDTMVVVAAVGSYLAKGAVLAWHVGDTDLGDSIQEAIHLGSDRTMQQDLTFGLMRLEDICLLALSPGINDLNTANEMITRIGAVLSALLPHDLGCHAEGEGRQIFFQDPTFADFLQASFGQIHLLARPHPRVLATLVRTLRSVSSIAASSKRPETLDDLERFTRLVMTDLQEHDEAGGRHAPI